MATISRLEDYENATNLIIYDHHLIEGSRVITLDKGTSTINVDFKSS